jgi:hypothetical protein
MPLLGFQNLDPRNFDCSGIGPGEDVQQEMRSLLNENDICDGTQDEDYHDDRSLGGSLSYFWQQLVVHFKIMFEGNKLVWPRSRHRS